MLDIDEGFDLQPESDSTPWDSGGDEPQEIIERIDLEALAEELYALLRKELRLERERQGRHGIR